MENFVKKRKKKRSVFKCEIMLFMIIVLMVLPIPRIYSHADLKNNALKLFFLFHTNTFALLLLLFTFK